ncbi:hypothetical protein VCHA37O177_30109 [Vibrio chagasii]|nr:hypothetical protein VCHA37O177_30109 [Vibrio chagasii]
MNHYNKLYSATYVIGISYIVIQTLGFSPQKGTIGREGASISGPIDSPELLPWLLILFGMLCALVLIFRGAREFLQKYKEIISRDIRLLRIAKETIREKTGIDHPLVE